MPQQEKITRKLDLAKSARVEGVRILAKTANYTVDPLLDSGSYILAQQANETHVIFFTLPTLATCNGHFWNFSTVNLGSMQIVSPASNAFVTAFGVNTLGVNFAGSKPGLGCRVIASGAKYYIVSANPFGSSIQANVGYTQG